jgi:hypothetical protein
MWTLRTTTSIAKLSKMQEFEASVSPEGKGKEK